MNRLTLLCCCLLFVSVGCKGDKAADTGKKTPPTAPTKAPEAAVGDPSAVPEANPTAENDAPVAAPDPEKAEKDPEADPANKLSNKVLERPARAAMTICARACNKAQQCGTARGNVSACIGACQTAVKAEAGTDEARSGNGFRAQDTCADQPCNTFDACVGRALIGEEALSKAPPISAKEAQPKCETLCAKELECHPKEAEKRPGGAATCIQSCLQVLINPTEAMAVQRVLMNKSYDCRDRACDAFEECVREGVLK